MDGNLHRAFGARGGLELPAAGEPDDGALASGICSAVDHVGAGQGGDGGACRSGEQLRRGSELDEAPAVDHADALR